MMLHFFFKIAYMDHLNIPTDRGTHQINYNLPRISNVTNEDFEFVMKVDRNRMSLDNAYGRLPVSHFSSSSLRPFPFLFSCHLLIAFCIFSFVISATPYAAAPIVENPVTPDEEVPGASSATLDDWLNQPGPSTQGLNQVNC